MSYFQFFNRRTRPLASICPNCNHEDGRNRNLARRVGGTVGGIAGTAAGVAGILSAARLGMTVGAIAGPVGSVMTGLAAATLRGIIGGTIGCEIGSSLGGLIDHHVLESDRCKHCGFPHGHDVGSQRRLNHSPWPNTPHYSMGSGNDDPDLDEEFPDGAPLPG